MPRAKGTNTKKPKENLTPQETPAESSGINFEDMPDKENKSTAVNKSKLKAADELMDKINAQYGDGTIMSGDEAVEKTRKIFIPTPSLELNIALGGGFIKGKVTELYGPESSGKTELILNTIGKHQKENPNFMAAWVETEGSLDLADAIKKHGIDKNRFKLLRFEPDKGAEWVMDRVRELIVSGLFDMIGVNSIAGLTPKEELDKNMGESVIAVQARMMSKFFRVTNALCDKHKVAVVFTNQERANIGSYGGGPTTGGGKALLYWAWQRVRMTREFIDKKKTPDIDAKKVIGIHAKITKNRAAVGNPFKECTYYAEYGKGINVYADLAKIIKREGVGVEVKGSWIYYPSKENVYIDKAGTKLAWNSVKELRLYLERSKKFFNHMYDKVLLFLNSELESEEGNDLGVSLSDEEINKIKKENKANAEYVAEVDDEVTDEEIKENEDV